MHRVQLLHSHNNNLLIEMSNLMGFPQFCPVQQIPPISAVYWLHFSTAYVIGLGTEDRCKRVTKISILSHLPSDGFSQTNIPGRVGGWKINSTSLTWTSNVPRFSSIFPVRNWQEEKNKPRQMMGRRLLFFLRGCAHRSACAPPDGQNSWLLLFISRHLDWR